MIIFIRAITYSDKSSLERVYKEVFSGFPWYEDLACKNCKSLYTDKQIRPESKERVAARGSLERCIKCNSPLELISYYPDIVNQQRLIEEAMSLRGFRGYCLLDQERIIGFSWGFSVPDSRTESVNFPEIIPALKQKEIDPSQAFYGAETGVIDSYQGKKLGKILVSQRSLAAYDQGYKTFVNRTINPKMRKITTELFSGKEANVLFRDPETGSQWFSWNFLDFNLEVAKNNMQELKCLT